IIITITIICFFFYQRKQNKTIKKLRLLIDKNRNPKAISNVDESHNNQPEENYLSLEKKTVLTSKMEARILLKLQKFESLNLFTQKTISMAFLTIYCETNLVYLSHVITTHKNKNFCDYINKLRINYIVEKLETDSKYRKYKIATLAEECGFSSPNKFCQIFKKEKSIPPSLFIKYLEDKTSYRN
ncbi:TPA: helix-turn-helix domain-containing protein, partial [Elizabethkingia anophelis]